MKIINFFVYEKNRKKILKEKRNYYYVFETLGFPIVVRVQQELFILFLVFEAIARIELLVANACYIVLVTI